MGTDIGVIGMGAMGKNITLLLASKGYSVTAYNRNEKGDTRLEDTKRDAKEQGLIDKCVFTADINEFMHSLKTPRKILIVISHGKNVDEVLGQIQGQLSARDLVVDCGNEWYEETERRIDEYAKRDVLYLGMGVSGGYQSARQGPSMSPGGPKEAYNAIEPILQKIAPKGKSGKPCFTYIGVGGSGHYVKMVHNGIEQGMMSAVSEVYGIMRDAQNMKAPQIAQVFERWTKTAEHNNNFLVQISADICTWHDMKNKDSFLIDYVMDNVTQDTDSSEGTGTWTVRDAAARHMPCPTIVAAHFVRLTSSYRTDRVECEQVTNMDFVDRPPPYSGIEEDMRMAVYTSHLCAFVEGFNLIVRASKDEKWNLNIPDILDIYRAGCIIQADYIIDLLQDVYNTNKETPLHNLFLDKRIAAEIKRGMRSLQNVVSHATLCGLPCPALSATYSHVLASYSSKLMTNMMQAQLDYFGLHKYTRTDQDLPREKELDHQTTHTEWKTPLEH